MKNILKDKTVFVDVDGTLLFKNEFNEKLIRYIKNNSQVAGGSTRFVLWSAAGRVYAAEMAKQAGISEYLEAILDKPHFVIDDQGCKWVEFTINLFRYFKPGG